MLLLSTALEKGFIPKEVVPAITTTPLTNELPQILPTLPTFKKKSSRSYTFTIPHTVRERRILAMPNPLHQLRLSIVICDNWTTIETFIGDPRSLSPSTPTVDLDSSRSLRPAIDFGEMRVEGLRQSTGMRYLLCSDFSRY